jgi:nitric oxide dioxygenase
MITISFLEVAEADDLARAGFAIQKGRITAAWLQEHVYPHAKVYVCGPRIFMQVMIYTLLNQGHPPSQIHWEVFGPALAFSPASSTTSSEDRSPLWASTRTISSVL